MAAGLPVLASDQAGLEGVVMPGETGAMVAAGDPAALAAAIAGLMADPAERSRLGAAAAQLARQSYDAAVQSRRLEELLLGAIG
jgi:glycosyltransferase involved in cell wall biosynthesis